MMNNEDRRNLEDAILRFPAEFNLRNFPGDTFRVSRGASYVNDKKEVILYTQIKRADGSWADFAKGTVAELRAQLVLS